mmetsp:Transcript_12516/g.37585  ORF Transcript_12516/g.37585 Transcript_12516/m.37585 type:complete len:350 (+) Transcript_12516:139-1188(+)
MTRPRSQAPTLASTSVPTAKRGGCTTHAWNASVSALRRGCMPRPMKMILDSRASPSAHSASTKPPCRSMWMAWRTNFLSLPATLRTALTRRKSMASSSVASKSSMNRWNKSMPIMPSQRTPTFEMDLSIRGFIQPLAKSSSEPRKPLNGAASARTFARLNAPTPKSFESGAAAFWHRITSAVVLISRTRASISARRFSSARSTLLSSTVDENAICAHAVPFASGSSFASASFISACLASTSATTLSTKNAAPISSFMKKVWTTGAGSAAPVSSIKTPSSACPFWTFSATFNSVATRSLRIVQQMQPLSRTTSSSPISWCFCSTSESSIDTSPISFSMTANFLSLCSRRM